MTQTRAHVGLRARLGRNWQQLQAVHARITAVCRAPPAPRHGSRQRAVDDVARKGRSARREIRPARLHPTTLSFWGVLETGGSTGAIELGETLDTVTTPAYSQS